MHGSPVNYTGALRIDINSSIENNLVVNQNLMDVFTAGWTEDGLPTTWFLGQVVSYRQCMLKESIEKT